MGRGGIRDRGLFGAAALCALILGFGSLGAELRYAWFVVFVYPPNDRIIVHWLDVAGPSGRALGWFAVTVGGVGMARALKTESNWGRVASVFVTLGGSLVAAAWVAEQVGIALAITGPTAGSESDWDWVRFVLHAGAALCQPALVVVLGLAAVRCVNRGGSTPEVFE